MGFPYCPHTDRLGQKLIEAYRRNDDWYEVGVNTVVTLMKPRPSIG